MIVRDRRVAELIDDTFHDCVPDRASWLDYQSEGANWSYRIRGPNGRAQTWRVGRFGKATGTKLLARVDASAGILSKAAGHNWIAVGDAASSFDPITSQGLFNALSSALVAAGILSSPEGLNASSARFYSDIVGKTFANSELQRLKVYELAAVHTGLVEPGGVEPPTS